MLIDRFLNCNNFNVSIPLTVQSRLNKNAHQVYQVNKNVCNSFNTPEDNSLYDLLLC